MLKSTYALPKALQKDFMNKMTKILLSILVSTSLVTAYALTNNQQDLSTPNTIAMDTSVKGWANEAFMAAYSYDFVKYNEELLQASKYFTPDAWKTFKSTLDKSGVIEFIKNRQLISVGLAEGVGPSIAYQGTLNGVKTWSVQFPAVINYQGPSSIQRVQHVTVSMIIINTNGIEGVRSMAITKMDVNFLSQNDTPPPPEHNIVLNIVKSHTDQNDQAATTATNDLPLDKPNMKTEDVELYAKEAVEAANTFDYENYLNQLQNAEKYFTDKGWTNFMNSINNSSIITNMIAKKIKEKGTVVGNTKVIEEGVISGIYTWKFEMPMVATSQFQPYDEKSTYSLAEVVTVTLVRQPYQNNNKGIGIQDIKQDIYRHP